jgi:hypothetical protein
MPPRHRKTRKFRLWPWACAYVLILAFGAVSPRLAEVLG